MYSPNANPIIFITFQNRTKSNMQLIVDFGIVSIRKPQEHINFQNLIARVRFIYSSQNRRKTKLEG